MVVRETEGYSMVHEDGGDKTVLMAKQHTRIRTATEGSPNFCKGEFIRFTLVEKCSNNVY